MSLIVQLSDCKLEWAKRQGKCQVADVPVRLIRVSSPYDDEKSISHFLTLSINLSFTLEVKTTTTTNDNGEKVKEKSYVKGREWGAGKTGDEKSLLRNYIKLPKLEMAAGSYNQVKSLQVHKSQIGYG